MTVLFCSDWGLRAYRDEEFGQELKWDVALLDGYWSEFLTNWSPKPNLSQFWGLINPSIVRRVRSGEFDAIWIHGWARATNWLAMVTAFASGVPVLLRGDSNPLASVPPWKATVKRAILTRLFRRVSALLAIGRLNADFYRAYGAPDSKLFFVPYAVDNDFFFSKAGELLPRRMELKRDIEVPPECPVILYSGKLVAWKRPFDLLKAFEQMSKSQRAALVYVGDGPLRSELEHYVGETGLSHVYFLGFQNQTALPRYFAMADIFVLPSDFEPWGLAVNEAMCFGLPVIVSDQVGAGPDLVRQGTNGFVYPVGRVGVLAELLGRLVANPDETGRMGESSRQLIESWSCAEDAKRVLACLDKVVGGNRSRGHSRAVLA